MSAPVRSRLARRLFVVSFLQVLLVIAGVLLVGTLVRAMMAPPDEEGEPRRHRHAHHHRGPGPWAPVLTAVACGLVVVAVGTGYMARRLVRPIERLEEASRALGRGDLSARSGWEGPDELGALSRTFDQMAERLERLVRAEQEMLANVAHELRTPLARIRVALDLAGEGDAVAARQSLAEIAVDLSELEELVNDVLAAARFDRAGAAQFVLHKERVPAREVAERAAARLAARYPSRPLALDDTSAGALVDADPALLRRALDKLLDNAHKYTPRPEEPLALEVRAAGGSVELLVRDRGLGIATEDLPLLFTPFFRADRSRARSSGGVGLGLVLAKRIVELHGGEIAVTSAPGEGTTFTVRLPAAAV